VTGYTLSSLSSCSPDFKADWIFYMRPLSYNTDGKAGDEQ